MNKFALTLAAVASLAAFAATAEDTATTEATTEAAAEATTEATAEATTEATTEVAAVVVTDADANGTYSMEELVAAYPELTEEAFKAIDTNADGAVDADELKAATDAGALK